MSEPRSWNLPEQHLMPDAVVAFVDGELSALARQRASEHIAKCPFCASETKTQRQARSAVQAAGDPGAPAGLLAALRAIPIDTELPGGPENLAIGPDGQLVAIQRPDRVPGLAGRSNGFGEQPMMGASSPLGHGSAVLRHRPPAGRRAVQGAGVVIGGLVLGALVVVGPHMLSGAQNAPTESPINGAGLDVNAPIGAGGVRAPTAVPVNNAADSRLAGQPAMVSTPATSTPATAVPVVNGHRYAH
ncbi:MAG TPA: zf-HC2 domain-containing protein [Pseudonocardiaceae bacterium]|jgi:hypothetical protein|nr:zf-HC2 domain-containing protein [Pseudonocardiaceae bacterium]